jgi:hypothetical protein
MYKTMTTTEMFVVEKLRTEHDNGMDLEKKKNTARKKAITVQNNYNYKKENSD